MPGLAEALLRPNPNIRDQKVLDIILNIGLLTKKKIKRHGYTLKFYDSKGELLVLRKVLKSGDIQYEVYKVTPKEFTDDLNYEQVPKLLIALITQNRIITEHFIDGVWTQRLLKLAEEHRNGDENEAIAIQRIKTRTPKKQPQR